MSVKQKKVNRCTPTQLRRSCAPTLSRGAGAGLNRPIILLDLVYKEGGGREEGALTDQVASSFEASNAMLEVGSQEISYLPFFPLRLTVLKIKSLVENRNVQLYPWHCVALKWRSEECLSLFK